MKKTFFIFLFFLFFGITKTAFAISDDFEAYSTGSLNGQDDWTAGNCVVADSGVIHGGSQSVGCTATADVVYMTHSLTGLSQQNFWFQFSDLPTTLASFVEFQNGSASLAGSQIYSDNNSGAFRLRGLDSTGGDFLNLGTGEFDDISLNVWHEIFVQWDGDNNLWRIKLDGNPYSSWYDGYTGAGNQWSDLSQATWRQPLTTGKYVYFDDFTEVETVPPSGVSFTTPVSDQNIAVGDFNFAGACTVNGSNRLVLTDCQYWQAPSSSTGFDIDCIGNAWSATSTALLGLNQKCVLDVDVLYGSYATATDQVVYVGATTTAPAELGFWGDIFNSLFVPNSQIVNSMHDDLISLLQTKSPFGYFYAIKNDILGIAGTSTPLTLSVSIPLGGTTTTVDVFDSESSTVHNFLSHFTTLITWLIWFMVALYIYHDVREINL